jgi:hypothetical protein
MLLLHFAALAPEVCVRESLPISHHTDTAVIILVLRALTPISSDIELKPQARLFFNCFYGVVTKSPAPTYVVAHLCQYLLLSIWVVSLLSDTLVAKS